MTDKQILSMAWASPWARSLRIGTLSAVSRETLENVLEDIGHATDHPPRISDTLGYWVNLENQAYQAASAHPLVRSLRFRPCLGGKWKRMFEAILANTEHMPDASPTSTKEKRAKTLVRLGKEFEEYKKRHEDHNPLGIGVELDDCYWFPTFPYYPEDQLFINGPPYRQVVDSLVNICHVEELIAGAKETIEGPHRVWYIFFYDGDTLRLSDMQAMLVLMGLLKGAKRWNEIENDIKPMFEQKLRIARIETWNKEPIKTEAEIIRAARKPLASDKPSAPKKRGRKKKASSVDSRAAGLLASLMAGIESGEEEETESIDDLLFSDSEEKEETPPVEKEEKADDVLSILEEAEEDDEDDILDWL